MTNEISWIARLTSEKARARRMVASGRAIIFQTIHETYLGKRGLVSYEAWDIVEIPPTRRALDQNISGSPPVRR